MRWSGILVVGVWGALAIGEVFAQETPPKGAAEKKEVASASKAFETAYNAHDVAKVVAQFTADAIVIDEDGKKAEGQKAIQQLFEQGLKEAPKGTIQVDVETIRPVTANVVIEDGWTTYIDEPNAAPTKRRYSIVNVKKDGKWLISSVRDYAPDSVTSPHEHLQEIAWLVGDWVDEHDDALVETSCRWSEDGNFLLQDFTVRLPGVASLKGTQRIGWDPIRKSFRSWTFDSEGGYTEATWWRAGYSWLLRAEGVTPQGVMASACRTMTPQGKDAYEMQITDRVSGGQRLPDITVTVVRKPPTPTQAPSSSPEKR